MKRIDYLIQYGYFHLFQILLAVLMVILNGLLYAVTRSVLVCFVVLPLLEFMFLLKLGMKMQHIIRTDIWRKQRAEEFLDGMEQAAFFPGERSTPGIFLGPVDAGLEEVEAVIEDDDYYEPPAGTLEMGQWYEYNPKPGDFPDGEAPLGFEWYVPGDDDAAKNN